MRKKQAFRCFLLTVATMALAFGGCQFITTNTSSTDSSIDSSIDTPSESSSLVSPTITISEKVLAMDVYDVVWLTATTTDTEETVVWTSSNSDKAVVDQNGRVQAKEAGTVTITATAGEVSDSCEITISESFTSPVLELSYNNVSINKGGEFILEIAALWKGEKVDEAIDYMWAVADGQPTGIASVEMTEDGDALVKGLAYGETSYVVSAIVRGVTLMQQVDIKVSNIDITFAIPNLESSANVYVANVALIETDTDKISITPEIIVYDKGEVVEGVASDIVWVNSDDTVVQFTDGVISGLKEGVAVLTGSYDGSAEIAIQVNVYRPTIQMEEAVVMETVQNNVQISTALQGAVTSAKYNETEIFVSFEDGILSYNKEVLPIAVNELGSGQVLTISTDKADYLFDTTAYTMIIDNEEEFNDFLTIAKEQNGDANKLNGYFVLGGNITMSAPYTGLKDSGLVYKADGAGMEGDYEFAGIFDGRGYAIDGIVIENANPRQTVFPTLNINSIVRNVAFTNAVLQYNGAFLAQRGDGKLENVYISIDIQSPDNTWGGYNTCAAVVNSMGNTFKADKLFIDEIGTNDKTNYKETAFGYGVPEGTHVWTDVYFVGFGQIMMNGHEALMAKTPANDYHKYATLAELKADATQDFSDWDNDFWNLANGLPYPASMAVPTISDDLGLSATEVGLEGVVEVTGTLKATDVITVTGGEASINGKTITVAPSVASGTELTVRVSSIYNAESVKEMKFTVLAREDITVAEKQSLELENANGIVLDLSAVEYNGTFNSVAYNGAILADATYDAETKKVTLAKAGLLGEYGTDKVFTLSFTGENDNGVVIYSINVTADIVTMVIDSEAEFNQFIAVSKAHGDANKLNGYFVLGGNVTMSAPYTGLKDSGLVYKADGAGMEGDYAFQGIFDGRGYTIDGLVFENANPRQTVFPTLGVNSIVRNVAFTNAVIKHNGAFLAQRAEGKLENVYISIDIQSPENTWSGYNVSAAVTISMANTFKADKLFIDEIGTNDKTNYKETAFGYGVPEGTHVWTDVYFVGLGQLMINGHEALMAKTPANDYHKYATLAELKADTTQDFSDWDNDFWNLANGLPYPASMAVPTISDDLGLSATEVGLEGVVEVTGTLKTTDVITVIGGEASVNGKTITVAPSVASGTELTVRVSSIYNAESVKEMKFTVLVREDITVAEKQSLELENANGIVLDLSAVEYNGTFNSVAYNGAILADATYDAETKKVTLAKAGLLGEYGTDKVFTLSFTGENDNGVVIYSINVTADIVTMVIDSEAELNQFIAVSKAHGEGTKLNGYFVLGGNVTMSAPYSGLKDSGLVYKADGSSLEGNYEFAGIFDGRGYAIDGLLIENANPRQTVFPTLGVSSIVRNVAFTNAVIKHNGAFLAQRAEGKLENVYISIDIQSPENTWSGYNVSAAVTISMANTFKADKLFIDEIGTNDKTNYKETAFGYGVPEGTHVWTDVYFVGLGQLMVNGHEALMQKTPANDYHKYATLAELKADATQDFSDWDNDFWNLANGLPYPASMAVPTISDDLGLSATEVGLEGVVEVTGTLKATDVITVTGGEASVNGKTITVAPSVASGTELTVRVSSIYNAESVKEMKFTVLVREDITVAEKQSLEVENANGIVLDLSAVEYNGTFNSVAYNRAILADATYDAETKKVTLAKAGLLGQYGTDKVFTLSFTGENDNGVVIYSINVTADIVTMVIDNEAELNQFIAVSKAHGEGTKLNGYFVLGSNVTMSAPYSGLKDSGLVYKADGAGMEGDYAFQGIFDGRGYAIDGLVFENANPRQTVFPTLGVSSIVRNVAFTNAVIKHNGAFLAQRAEGKLENVYISIDIQSPENTWSGYNVSAAVTISMANTFKADKLFIDEIGTNDKTNYKETAFGYGVPEGTHVWTDVYFVGFGQLMINGHEALMAKTPANDYHKYATLAALKADATQDFSDWDNDFWNIVDGIPVPASMVVAE